MIIKDAMVLIHITKLKIIDEIIKTYKRIVIPKLVYQEIMKGKEKQYTDAYIIDNLIKQNKIKIKNIKDKSLIKKANKYNIYKGEAEAVALYWELKSELLATDDDNVRKKKEVLELKIISTPAIILNLFKRKILDKKKTLNSIQTLKKIGWFSQAVIDKMKLVVENE